MTASAHRLHRWIFWLTCGLLLAATALRSVLSPSVEARENEVLLLLAAWLGLLLLDASLTPRWPSCCPLAMAAQTIILFVLMERVWHGDFYAVLFGVMSMRAMERFGWRTTGLWIALFAPVTALALSASYDVAEAVVFAVTYACLAAFLALFTLITRRTEQARLHDEELGRDLAAAGREVEAYAHRVERLASLEERHRLARELHDSVTQTVFSMNLTAQSAALLLARDRVAAAGQLERLAELSHHALAEIRALGDELTEGQARPGGGLEDALRRHIAARTWPDGLVVTLEVDDATRPAAGAPDPAADTAANGLSEVEEHALFRIAQEALNNVVKHARARAATVRLRLAPPARLEVVDDGCGFDPGEQRSGAGMGLGGMRERTEEIGWRLEVVAAPGAGTRVLAEGPAGGTEILAEERTEG